MQTSSDSPAPLVHGSRIRIAIEFLLWTSLVITLGKLMLAPASREMIDFDIFHLVGKMIWRGAVIDAYRFETLAPEMIAAYQAESYMAWNYPPPFNLVVAALGALPFLAAFTLFVAGSLAFYLTVVNRLAGELSWLALAAVFPSLCISIYAGQNGMLTGGLVGLFCLRMRAGGKWAGIPLGLMCMKPHLAISFAAYVLLTRRWDIAATAGLTVATSCALATIALGLDVWPAFLAGLSEAKVFLTEGFYPLHRMVSLYAAAFTLGLSAKTAAALQLVLGLAVVSAIAWCITRGLPQRQVLATAAIGAVMISPYGYDYDLPVAAIGLALLSVDFASWPPSQRAVVHGLLAFSGFYGVLATHTLHVDEAAGSVLPTHPPSIAAFALLILMGIVVNGLAAPPRGAPASTCPPAAK